MTRDLRLLVIAMFTWGIGEGMFLIFQPIYLEQLGADPLLIGAILGAAGITMAIAQAPAGHLADRIGPRPVMWATWLLGTCAAAMMALARSLPFFVAGLLTYGLTSSVVAPLYSYAASVRGTWATERTLATVSAAFNAGAILGPVAGGWLGEEYGLRIVYAISACIFVLSTLVILQARPSRIESQPGAEAETSTLLRNRRFFVLMGLTFLTLFALYFSQPLTPNFLQNQRGLDLNTIGMLGTAGSLGNMALALALGHLPAAIGFTAAQPLVAIFAALMWKGETAFLFGIGFFFFGGYRLARTMSLALSRPLIRASETGLAFGLLETMNAAAMILSPPLAGFLYDRQPDSMYPAALVLIGAMFILNLVALPRLVRGTAPRSKDIPSLANEP